MITIPWVVSDAEEMPVPSGAVPTKVKDGWSFTDADELGVKSVVGRDEELESLSSEFTHIGQQRPEMISGKIQEQERGEHCPGVRCSRLRVKHWLRQLCKGSLCVELVYERAEARDNRTLRRQWKLTVSCTSTKSVAYVGCQQVWLCQRDSEQLTSWTGNCHWNGQYHDEKRLDEMHDETDTQADE